PPNPVGAGPPRPRGAGVSALRHSSSLRHPGTISLTPLGRLSILGVMADPVRKITAPRQGAPLRRLLDEEPGMTLLRWVKGPDGELRQVEMPLTPERFLN